jgi:hypothetical protein
VTSPGVLAAQRASIEEILRGVIAQSAMTRGWKTPIARLAGETPEAALAEGHYEWVYRAALGIVYPGFS